MSLCGGKLGLPLYVFCGVDLAATTRLDCCPTISFFISWGQRGGLLYPGVDDDSVLHACDYALSALISSPPLAMRS